MSGVPNMSEISRGPALQCAVVAWAVLGGWIGAGAVHAADSAGPTRAADGGKGEPAREKKQLPLPARKPAEAKQSSRAPASGNPSGSDIAGGGALCSGQ